jgi:pimeloyl-ACP methyl ester carboxylesterase
VILTDNAGVGLSTGQAPETVGGMARDAASLIDALGLEPSLETPFKKFAASSIGLEFRAMKVRRP